MLGRIILVVVALCAAGLFWLPGLDGGRTAGTPTVNGDSTTSAASAWNRPPFDLDAVRSAFGRLPLYFVENRGVCPAEVAYYIQGVDRTLFFAPDGITIRLNDEDRGWVVKLEFVDSDRVVPRGEDRQEAVFSYFKGSVKNWKAGLRTYSRVVYENLWPGIDLVYRGTVNRLKYEFRVKPGADPGRIRLRYRGVESLDLTANGALAVKTSVGGFEDAPPEAWQEIEGKRVPVAMEYRLDPADPGDAALPGGVKTRSYGFRVGQYDSRRPLILDPAILVYCGYIGGSGADDNYLYGFRIAVDRAGQAYVTGSTQSTEQTFPVTVGPDRTYNGGLRDAFVAKVNAAGTGLVYCGYIGGNDMDWGYGIAVDESGHAYVAGATLSTEQTFPVTVGPDLTYNTGRDAFVAKLNISGTGLEYAGYIGGTSDDWAYCIGVDGSGNAYVSGGTRSPEQTFPVKVGPDLTYNGGAYDGYVAKVTASGAGLVFCGYIGGSGIDYGWGMTVDRSGNMYVTGDTGSTEQTFPVTVGPDLTYNGGSQDAYVARVSMSGAGLVFCGYIGGDGSDYAWGMAVDGSGNAYVTGDTDSSEQTFPVRVGPDLTYNGGPGDAYVAKVKASGAGFAYCGYIGGSGYDVSNDIAVDAAGNAFVAGQTGSGQQTFPVVAGPDLTYNTGGDAFVAGVEAAGTGLLFCGYIGGSKADYGRGIAVDESGNAYVVGETYSTELTFPVTVGPDLSYNGLSDVFVAKVAGTALVGAGSPVPGGQVDLYLSMVGGAGLVYQLGSSSGVGPIMIAGRRLDLSSDPLLFLTVSGALSSVFRNYSGVLDAQGRAVTMIKIPNVPALKSIRIYTAFVTLKASAPSGIASISNTFVFTIQ